MQGYNLVMIYNTDADMLLMCERLKDPYFGLYNLPGGKIEAGEDGLDAAYRELLEETGITKNDVTLTHLMDFTYYLQDCYVEVYAGRLKNTVEVFGEENTLFWSELGYDFFDLKHYAGEGNIGHMIQQVNLYREEILGQK